MTPLGAALLSVIAVSAIVLGVFAFYEYGYRHGLHDAAKKYYALGFESGRAAGEQWLVNLETSVQDEREKIWREEMQR